MGQVDNGATPEMKTFSAKRIGQINLNSEDWSEEYETGLMLHKLIGSSGRSSLKADFEAIGGRGCHGVRLSFGRK